MISLVSSPCPGPPRLETAVRSSVGPRHWQGSDVTVR